MKTRASTDIVASILTLTALAVTLWWVWRPPPPLDRKLHGAIGEALAKAALPLLGPTGQILLITRDTEAFPQPALDALLRGFKKELARSHISIASTQLLQTDPLRPVDVPSGDFFEMIRRAPAGHVIVSLLGPPLLTPEQRRRLGVIKPKIVAFCSGAQAESLDLRELSGGGLLHAAVVSRISLGSQAKPAVPPRSFAELYTTLSPADLGSPSRQSQP